MLSKLFRLGSLMFLLLGFIVNFALMIFPIKNRFLRFIALILTSIVLFSGIIIILFFFFFHNYRIFHVPSGSMESTLFVGDRILVELSEINERNAIVVVRDPITPNNFLVKRLVGLPGETIAIKGDSVLVDNKIQPLNGTMHNRYKVKGSVDEINAMLRFLKITKGDSSYRKADQSIVLTLPQKREVQKQLTKLTFTSAHEPYSAQLFPKENPYNWSRSHYGPLLIPKKDIIVTLNKSFSVYRRILDYEKTKYTINGNELWISNLKTNNYRFKNDYCFLLGDNRPFSFDSRYIGFVPTKNIEGKVIRIIWSIDPSTKSIRWNRIWKKID